MVPEDLDIDLESDATLGENYGNGRKSGGRKLSSSAEATLLRIKQESETEESNDSHYPLSLSMNNGHHGNSF